MINGNGKIKELTRSVPRALIVCDRPDAEPVWRSALMLRHTQTFVISTYAHAIQNWAELTPDLVILDIRTPSPEVIDLIKDLRRYSMNPILLFCEKSKEEDILEAYAAGADDCIFKPVSPTLFLAKLQAWMRRAWTVSSTFLETLQAGRVRLVPAEHQLILEDGLEVRLTNLELHLLHLLISRPNKTIGNEELIQRIWRSQGDGDITTLKNVVYRLRKKIEGNPAYPRRLVNVAGAGYSFHTE